MVKENPIPNRDPWKLETLGTMPENRKERKSLIPNLLRKSSERRNHP
jgi:hypothetical protein